MMIRIYIKVLYCSILCVLIRNWFKCCKYRTTLTLLVQSLFINFVILVPFLSLVVDLWYEWCYPSFNWWILMPKINMLLCACWRKSSHHEIFICIPIVWLKVSQDVPKYAMVSGERAELRGLNLEGLRRRGFTATEVGIECFYLFSHW